jgi:hypothetical protein
MCAFGGKAKVRTCPRYVRAGSRWYRRYFATLSIQHSASPLKASGAIVNQLRQGVQLSWRERGGPTVTNPRHAGFGSMLLKATFPNAQVDYAPEGLRCQFDVSTANDDKATVLQSHL